MRTKRLGNLLAAAGLGVAAAIAMTATTDAAHAQAATAPRISVPAMPLDQALRQIAAQSGTAVDSDPSAVAGLTSAPVTGARSVRAAVQAAIRETSLTIFTSADGGMTVVNDIVVVARRDEAETNVLVRQTSTSDRNGLSLREQPRNTQVISAKTIADQQALTIGDVLRNAGGVSTQANSPQGGASYTVRGFGSGGLVNGLSGSSTFGVAAGSNQPVANIERVEVLKGPDALLVGFDNLGGNVNVVTKRPSADALLYATFDTGSYGLARGTIDANNAITDNRKLSARIVASAQTMDRNYGGYKGDREYLFAPSIRFKDERTDVLLGISTGTTVNGRVAFTAFDQRVGKLFERDPSVPLYSKDQSIRVADTRYYFDVSRELFDGATVIVRGLHDELKLGLNLYPITVNAQGRATISIRGSGQVGESDAIDGFVRFSKKLGENINFKLNAGYNYSSGYFEPRSSTTFVSIRNIPFENINTVAVQPRPSATRRTFRLGTEQQGVYAQGLLEFWKVHILGGARYNWYRQTFESFGTPPDPATKDNALVPNFGAVVDITDNISLFGNYVEGNAVVTSRDVNGDPLPNIRSKNKEAGVKIDLFGDRVVVNASYFDLLQDNVILADPNNPGFDISGPGQRGRGIDLSVAGTILPGWTVQASVTRTKYRYLSPDAFLTTVTAQPRETYSLYSAYRTGIAEGLSGGVAAGLFGRSRSAADSLGRFYVPASHQVDLNGFLSFAGFDLNIGVRNVFDRRNYNVASTPGFIPIDEPRNWRLTIGKRFF